jgi:hypothetical protein
MQWLNEESVIKQFHGGRSFHVKEDLGTPQHDLYTGTWYITNRRLVFVRGEERFSYDLRKVRNVSLFDDKHLSFIYRESDGDNVVRIPAEHATQFKEMLQERLGSINDERPPARA